MVIPEQNAVVYDPCIPYEQAAMFEPSTVALHGVYQNQYQGGGYVAILGGGTIGMFYDAMDQDLRIQESGGF